MSESEENDDRFFEIIKKKQKKGIGFQLFSLSKPLSSAIYRKGYKNPTPIQRKTIPLILDGKDVIGMSRTGSGKTLAFLVPIIEKLYHESGKSGVKAVILSPTRELAVQTYRVFRDLNRETKLKSICLLGGDALGKHFSAMHTNPDIIIATPGRLLHVLVEMDLKLPEVKYFVMDECDRLFEMGFEEQITELIRRLPDHRQNLLFSATLPQSVANFVKSFIHDPALVRLDIESKLSENLTSVYLMTRESEKLPTLLYLLKEMIKKDEMTLIFAATRHHVEYLQLVLEKASIDSTHVYSALDQEARKTNIDLFRKKKVRTMIVTDVAARGIDIPFLDNVINFNFPGKSKLYVHRVGRVARAGRTGFAYSLVSTDELPFLQELHLFLGKGIKVAQSGSPFEDGYIGKIPQSIIDSELDSVNKWHESYSDLGAMKKVCENATKQYIKTRALPSGESVNKAKEIAKREISVHPMFKNLEQKEDEVKKNDFLASLKGYKPRSTIFEVGQNKKEFFNVMKSKRQHHDKLVQKIKSSRENEKFSEARDQDFKDDSFFLNYQANDHFTEKGLEIERGFNNALDEAIIDIGDDEAKSIRKPKSSMRWDRKKKKFVNDEQNDSKKKKIKTESGAWISASYKTDLYKKWKEANRAQDDDDDDGEENNQEELRQRDQELEKRFKKKFKSKNQKSPKSELKSKADLLKQRMQQDRKRKFMEWRRREKSKRKANK